MCNSAHRIRRQRWLLRCETAPIAFRLRQRLREGWQATFVRAFESAFDQEFQSEEVIHLATLNFRLKFLSEEAMIELLPELLHQQLVRQIREIFFNRPGLNEKLAPYRKSTLQQSRLETLLRYLRTATAPWEVVDDGRSSLAEELKETCRQQWPEVQASLRTGKLSAASYSRLLQLIAPFDARRVARELIDDIPLPQKGSLMEALILLLETGDKYFGRYVQLQLAALFLSQAMVRREHWTVRDFVLAARRLLPLDKRGLDGFVSSLPAPSAALFQKVEQREARVETDPTSQSHLRAAQTRERTTVTKRREPSPIPRPWREDKVSQGALESGRDSLSKREPGDNFPLRVNHAGLILLHPFLPRFFESTGVLEKRGLKLSPHVLPRAAALLHYLSAGHDNIYEYGITFIKVLLGLDPEASLCVTEGLLADPDKLEAEGLLEAAIGHWPALKRTSTAGFRSSFLQRSALLREEEKGWRLQVEGRSVDLLLEHLPWSISIVKLPWMPRPLHIEW